MAENNEKKHHSIILGLDISTACIGISLVHDDGESKPEILKITHVVPKIDKNIKGIEALILRKKIFEEEFLNGIRDEIHITDCVIEAPLKFATGNSNADTVATLLQFNALISEAVYEKLGLVPYYFTSYDARMYAFPKLLAIRKFNKKGEPYPLAHIKKCIRENNLTLFGVYPFDCEKKTIMMECVNEVYDGINWVYNAKGNLKKENYDACDSLICSLALVQKKRFGEMNSSIENVVFNSDTVEYDVKPWKDSDFTIHKAIKFEAEEKNEKKEEKDAENEEEKPLPFNLTREELREITDEAIDNHLKKRKKKVQK